MEVLITGNIKWLENDFFKVLAEKNKVIVSGKGAERIEVDKVTPYKYEIGQEEFEKMFGTYNFNCVVYFSQSLGQDAYRELSYLDNIFSLCKKRAGTKLVYVSHSKQVSSAYGQTHEIITDACQKMCNNYCEEGNTLLSLTVPYLVSEETPVGIVLNYFESIENSEKIETVFSYDCCSHCRSLYLFGIQKIL